MLIVRPIRNGDLDMLIDLARKAGPGFTSLAVGDDILEKRLEKSVKSFSNLDNISPDHAYFLVLEDTVMDRIVGISAVKAQIGLRDPFFNFRILNVAQKSAVTDRRFDMEVLVLVNEYGGATEVGTLFILPEMRGTGAGRLISQARYMLMATAPQRFSDQVISELRGHVDDTGYSPFWEAIGRKFFDMDFIEADNISAEKDNQFILDLMPKYPIYAALLPLDAQAAMGQTHPSGVGARRFLESEGFRYNGVIDIFDAGPSMSVPRNDIRTIRESRIMTAVKNDPSGGGQQTALIGNEKISDFRCVMDALTLSGDQAVISEEAFSELNLEPGDPVRIWIKS